jgi:hypothetical protein
MAVSRLARDIVEHLIECDIIPAGRFADEELETREEAEREVQSVITRHAHAENACKVTPKSAQAGE